MDETFARFEAQYCPPVDPALLSALLSDYDITNEHGLDDAKRVLDQLKEDAVLDEAAGFDPSGTGAGGAGAMMEDRTETQPDTSVPVSREADPTSLSNGLFSLDLLDDYTRDDAGVGVYDESEDFDKLDESAKIVRLQGIFGDQINRYSIQHTLRKCNGSWDAAVEDLLSQAYVTGAENTSDGSIVNAKGIDAFSEEHIVLRGRKGKVKNIPSLHNVTISDPDDVEGAQLRLIPQYKRLDVSDADLDWDTAAKRVKSATSSRSPSSDVISATAQRDTYALARAAALSNANAAYRKAKSDRLMGGAAAYYGQVGREYAALSSNASANAADALVTSQSTPTQLDLHGVDVQNAIRIAQNGVEAWWKDLGESRVNGRVGAADRQIGFRIVVGLGRHSEGGKGKLGPAVTKMLKQGGWKVEPAGAVILVKGPLKR